MPLAPDRFDGTLEELFTRAIEELLIPAGTVEAAHRQLVDYCRSSDPILLVRKVRNLKRRVIYRTADGTRIKPTDNSPTWWMHSRLFHEGVIAPLPEVIEEVPTHFSNVNASRAYNEHGVYHYPTPPRKADPFRVTGTSN